jgi:ABC-type polysaccharide/polyol phosphate export permease
MAGFVPALRECLALLADYERWTTLAWADMLLRYRRTVLGPLWATLSIGVMTGSVGLVFGAIFGGEMSKFLPFFAIGLVVWTFISSSVTEGCSIFLIAAGLIKSIPTPLILHIYRMMWRQLIVLAHHLMIPVFVWLIFGWELGWNTLLALPGFVLVWLAVLGAVMVLAMLCTRFRDVQQIIVTMLQLLFLLTPIVWMPKSLRAEISGFILDWNPIYYLIEVVRGPLLGEVPEMHIWLGAIAVAALSLGTGLTLYGWLRHRIAYWL